MVSNSSILIARLRVSIRNRYLASLVIVAILKLVAGVWVYTLVTEFSGSAPSSFGIFQGWDSVYYVAIASSGYSGKLYAFFPAFPALIRALSYVVHDQLAASAFLSIILGLAWIPVFQKLAEEYLPVRDALEATILAATFPIVFLFTTLAYTEGLFALATVSAWYLHLRQKYAAAALAATLATLTRPPGILILLPMIANVRRVDGKLTLNFDFHGSYYFAPIASLLIWVSYVQVVTGSWLTIPESITTWVGPPGSNTLGPSFLQLFGTTHYHTLWPPGELRPIPIIAFVVLASFFVSRTWRIDRRLGVYSWLLFLLFFATTYMFSLIRYVSFIFPTWLVMRSDSRIGLVIVTALFLLVSVYLWFLFLTGFFIG